MDKEELRRLLKAGVLRRWANDLANLRQGQSETPRCEPPGEYAVDRAERDIATALEAATQGTADNARIEAVLEAFRDVADIVAVWAQQPVEATRQRNPLEQETWDQLAKIVGEKFQEARAIIEGKAS